MRLFKIFLFFSIFCLIIYKLDVIAMESSIKGNEIIKTEKRTFPFFSFINIQGAYDAEIICRQQKQQIEITGDDNILPHIVTKLKEHTLFIYADKPYSSKMKIKLNIYADNIENLSASGDNNINISKIEGENLELDISGATELHVSGNTKMLNANLSGAANIYAQNLRSEVAQIKITGAGNASVNVSQILQGDITGVGNIEYYGNPKKILRNILGVGTITKKN